MLVLMTIEQLLMVHIVERRCQIEHDEHCLVRRLFLEKPTAMSAVIVDNECMSSVLAESHVDQGGNGCVSVFWAAGVFPSFLPLGTVD